MRTGEAVETAIKDVQSKTLPDDIVEKIMAMVPFPQIFKARVLSKSWYARFQPISALHNEEERRLARSFQKQVLEFSSGWDTFWPLRPGLNPFMAL
ncbi:unnamed protein product [Calypogeia fissa]